MKYGKSTIKVFPTIRNIDDILPHIEGMDEFTVRERDFGKVITYDFQENATFAPHASLPFRRECRGIKFNKSGKIIARPFHKFFNLDEKEETLAKNVDLTAPHRVLVKLDGSMVHPIMMDGDIVWCTKAGVTEISEFAHKFVDSHPPLYNDLVLDLWHDDWMPIFEYCSWQNKIVIDYEENLTLLAVRHIYSGEYSSHSLVKQTAASYHIPCVANYDGNHTDINTLNHQVKALEGMEGIVVRFEDGQMIKIKALDYLIKHRAMEMANSEKFILQAVFEDKGDDYIANVPDEGIRAKVADFIESVNANIDIRVQEIKTIYDSRSYKTKKDYALSEDYANDIPHIRSIMFFLMDGADSINVLIRGIIKKNLGSSTKIDNARHLFGNIRLADFMELLDNKSKIQEYCEYTNDDLLEMEIAALKQEKNPPPNRRKLK